MTNEVELQGWIQLSDLFPGILKIIFAKDNLAVLKRLCNRLNRHPFGNSNKTYIFRIPAAPLSSLADTGSDFIKVFTNHRLHSPGRANSSVVFIVVCSATASTDIFFISATLAAVYPR